MHFPFLHPITNNHRPDEQPSVRHEPESLSVEGGEFLDDALRMEDLTPRIEVCVSTGAPENLH